MNELCFVFGRKTPKETEGMRLVPPVDSEGWCVLGMGLLPPQCQAMFFNDPLLSRAFEAFNELIPDLLYQQHCHVTSEQPNHQTYWAINASPSPNHATLSLSLLCRGITSISLWKTPTPPSMPTSHLISSVTLPPTTAPAQGAL